MRAFLLPMLINLFQVCQFENQVDAGLCGFGFIGSWEATGLWCFWEVSQSTNWRELRMWTLQVFQFALELENRVSRYSTNSMVA